MKGKLAYLLGDLPRYSETFILNELLALDKLGLPSRIFCMRGEVGAAESLSALLHANVEILGGAGEGVSLDLDHVVGAMERSREALGEEFASAESKARARVAGGSVLSGRKGPYARLAFAIALAARCRELSISHVHAHYAGEPTEVAQMAERLGGASVSFTGHAKDIFTLDPARLAKRVARASFVVSCSATGVEHIRRAAPQFSSRVHLVYHGLWMSEWLKVERAPEPSRGIVSVGRLTPKKGFATLVEALAILRGGALDVSATIIGDGREEDALLSQARALGVGDLLHLSGRADHSAIRREFARAEMFALPSVVLPSMNQDGVANSLLEAMASAMPVVVSDIPAFLEIVEDGRTGLVFRSGDPKALAAAIARIVREPELAERLGRAARERVASLDCSRAAANLAELFDRHA